MRVIATAAGFYPDTLRQPGDEFEVPDDMTATWFKPLDDEPARPAAKKVAKAEPRTFSEIAKKDADAQKPKGADELA